MYFHIDICVYEYSNEQSPQAPATKSSLPSATVSSYRAAKTAKTRNFVIEVSPFLPRLHK